MTAVYKFVLCLMRRFVKSDKINALVAGFLSGLASRLDDKDRRMFLLVLLLSRVSDTAFNMAENRNMVTRF
jgi:hypothetical protein